MGTGLTHNLPWGLRAGVAERMKTSFSNIGRGIGSPRWMVLACAAAACLLCSGSLKGAIQNGGFEDNSFIEQLSYIPDSDFNGSTNLTGWIAGGLTSVIAPDLYRNGPYYNATRGPANPLDRFFLGLYGPQGDFVEQSFSTAIGTSYLVIFEQSHGAVFDSRVNGWVYNSTSGGIRATITGSSLLSDTTFAPSGPTVPANAAGPVPNGTNGLWEVRTFSFTADSASTTIRFTGTGDGVQFLDDVQITQVPSTLPTYDLSRDFLATSNPAGAWSYGWVSTLDGAFALLPFEKNFSSVNGAPLSAWQTSATQQPSVARNMGSTIADSGDGVFVAPPGTVWFSPGEDGTPRNFAVIRLTLPPGSDGDYQLETSGSSVFNGAASSDCDFHLVRNGQELFGQFLPPNSGTSYTNSLHLTAGDTLDFDVGRGQDGLRQNAGLKIQASLTLLNGTGPPVLVVPSIYEHVNGSGSGLLTAVLRQQDVYGASLFPAQPIVIRELRFRPSADYGHAFTSTISNLQINLSTTAAVPEQLSATFANNLGVNDTVVFHGAISLSSAFNGPPGGPKDFDIVIPLTTPFLYDSAAGNLCVEWRNFSGSGVTIVDAGPAVGDQGSRLFTLDANATVATGIDAGSEIMQIVYTVEPTAPSIISQPESQIATAGANVTFTVVAGGTPPFSYQWIFNGTEISGAISPSLALNHVQTANSGNYSVTVTNAYGRVTSGDAALAVTNVGRFVVPSIYEHVNGSGSGLLTAVLRQQDVYGASLFPAQPIVIRELRFRPSADYGHAFTSTISNLQINLSTTAAVPEQLLTSK